VTTTISTTEHKRSLVTLLSIQICFHITNVYFVDAASNLTHSRCLVKYFSK